MRLITKSLFEASWARRRRARQRVGFHSYSIGLGDCAGSVVGSAMASEGQNSRQSPPRGFRAGFVVMISTALWRLRGVSPGLEASKETAGGAAFPTEVSADRGCGSLCRARASGNASVSEVRGSSTRRQGQRAAVRERCLHVSGARPPRARESRHLSALGLALLGLRTRHK